MATQKTRVKTRPWDPAKTIRDHEEAAVYLDVALEEAFQDGYFAAVRDVIWDIVRYKGSAKVAHDLGMDVEELKKMFSADSTPDLSLVLKVVKALGLQLHATVADAKSDG
ncbi:MAG: putative addiction module antidote protein [Chloroflexota bacterium]|nr:putative addiction module antidote protein [Chloroflexota bacterium]MDE2969096.1 putative addiction module antidote protein [Chloroflexota bacterium]